MNVWEIVFELHWSYMDEGEFTENDPETYHVVAPDYNSALEEGRLIALAEMFKDDEAPYEVYTVTDARIVGIKRGISIDGIATGKNVSA
jgi:hypothetical protein